MSRSAAARMSSGARLAASDDRARAASPASLNPCTSRAVAYWSASRERGRWSGPVALGGVSPARHPYVASAPSTARAARREAVSCPSVKDATRGWSTADASSPLPWSR